MISSIDKLNQLRAKYDVLGVNNGAQNTGLAQGIPSAFGNDGTNLSKELNPNNQGLPKQNDGSGAMWAMFGVNLGMNILNGVLGLFGKKGGGGGGGGGEDGGDEQEGGGGG